MSSPFCSLLSRVLIRLISSFFFLFYLIRFDFIILGRGFYYSSFLFLFYIFQILFYFFFNICKNRYCLDLKLFLLLFLYLNCFKRLIDLSLKTIIEVIFLWGRESFSFTNLILFILFLNIQKKKSRRFVRFHSNDRTTRTTRLKSVGKIENRVEGSRKRTFSLYF